MMVMCPDSKVVENIFIFMSKQSLFAYKLFA